MYSVNAFAYVRKLLAALLVISVMYGVATPLGLHYSVERARAADVCDGTCG
jgi:hypothetical protein